ncbi:hypothetical protein [Niallia sp. NCCP-28]|uniref:hypothetical protein n=1 Tax=Niallia sp. NCCP-28 TaxID=2934712 RepID=UPI00208C4C02|nr:hypothetical protein [Niallia sp. NCCP-28]GKU83216.1 hypothetical protein NCCP28_26120 [Niallia sp. NCCP-28]
MHQLVKRLIDNLNKSNAIKPLLYKKTFILLVKCEEEHYCIQLKNVQFHLVEKLECKPDIVLEGCRKGLQAILLGKTLLRESKKSQDIFITSNFRKVLMLESLFYLGNLHDAAAE